jgi:hypothetical protein
MVHPSISTQIDHLGNTYQQQHAEAMRLQQEMVFFFEYSQSIMKKLVGQNNRLLEKMRKPTIPDELHRKEVALSDQLAQMTQSYLPQFKELIECKPLLDKVFDFEQRLVKDLQRLHQLEKDGNRSQSIWQALKNEHEVASQQLIKLKLRLEHCKTLMNELISLGQHQLN